MEYWMNYQNFITPWMKIWSCTNNMLVCNMEECNSKGWKQEEDKKNSPDGCLIGGKNMALSEMANGWFFLFFSFFHSKLKEECSSIWIFFMRKIRLQQAFQSINLTRNFILSLDFNGSKLFIIPYFERIWW